MSKIRKIMVNGEIVEHVQEGEVVQWGRFYDWMQDLHERYEKIRKVERDPYMQIILDEQLRSINEAGVSYYTFATTINTRKFLTVDDVAKHWLADIEKIMNATKALERKETKPYMLNAYGGKQKVLKQILNQFKGFILEV
jgi:hypothetical protein